MIDNNLEEKNKIKRKNASLTHSEWMTFFFLPFFNRQPFGYDEEISKNELERFRQHGFEKKINEALKAKRQGMRFWFVTLVIVIFAFAYYYRIFS